MARIGAGRVFAYPADFSRGVKVRHAGKVRLPVELTAAGQQLLREDGQVKVRMRISFKAEGEGTVSRMLGITLKKKAVLRPKRGSH